MSAKKRTTLELNLVASRRALLDTGRTTDSNVRDEYYMFVGDVDATCRQSSHEESCPTG